MKEYLIRRLLLFIPTLFLVSVIIFTLVRIVPGDAALIALAGYGGEASFTEEEYQRKRAELGLDKSLPNQYVTWVSSVLAGHLGKSVYTGRPIADELLERIPKTMELALLAVLVAVSVGVPMGVISAIQQDRLADYTLRVFAIMGLSMPTFWTGLLALVSLVVFFHWFPPLGYVSLWDDPVTNFKQMVLPALTLGYFLNASITRMTRSQMLEVLREDYIRTARAKGLADTIVVYRHALKNAIIPVLTLLGTQLGHLLGGAVVTETVFAIPGVGRVFVEAVFTRDYPMVQAVVLFMALVFLIMNLLVDLAYGWLDPRIRYA